MSPRALLASLIAISTHAMWYKASVELNGANEVPPADTESTGTAQVTFNSDTHELTWYIEHNIPHGTITSVHFHGPSATNATAAVQITLLAYYESPMEGSYQLDVNQTTDILNGLYYINIHSNDFPAGEIRGQVYLFEDYIQTWEEEFDHTMILYNAEDGHYQIFWTLHEADKWIEMGIAAQTEGYIGFGISRNGEGMANSDVILGWITADNEVILENRYRENGNGTPRIFEDQNYVRFIDGFKQIINGVTSSYLHFEKAMNGVRDDDRAVPLKYGTNHVIWAIGNVELPVDGTPVNHGNCDRCRGLTTVNFNMSSADDSTAWYTIFGGIVIGLVIFMCGLCGGCFMNKKGWCKSVSLNYQESDTSIQKKNLLEKQ